MDNTIRVGIDLTSIISKKEIDNECFQFSISLFVADIIDGWIENKLGENISVFTFDWARPYLKKRFPGIRIISVGNKVYDLLNRTTGKNIYSRLNINSMLFSAMKRSDVDIIWNPFVRTWKGKYPKVSIATVHDLIDYKVSEKEQTKCFEKSIHSTDHLVAISEYVKEDCKRSFSLDEEKITVIPNAIHIKKTAEYPIDGIESKYILDVNAFRVHKNTITLIRAFCEIKDETDCDLILCAGGKNEEYFKKIQEEIKKNNMENRVKILYQISETQLNWLYNHAVLFVNPSLQEGFGRTPVEAILHGVPVLTTKETSLYEVTMGMLEYIDNPNDYKEIARKILKLLHFDIPYNISEVQEKYRKNYSPQRISLLYWNEFRKWVKQ